MHFRSHLKSKFFAAACLIYASIRCASNDLTDKIFQLEIVQEMANAKL